MVKKTIKKKKKLRVAKRHLRKTRKIKHLKRRGITLRKTRRVRHLKRKPASVIKKEKKEVIGSQEIVIEEAKFYTPAPEKPTRVMPQELPGGYGENKIVLQVRDPWWLHSYWEVTPDKWDSLKGKLGEAFYAARKVLRVYDISQIIFDGKNAHRFFDIEIGPEASNWYINAGAPGRSWCVDLGLRLANGEFITIVRSNTVDTPLDGPSWITDEEWMIPEDMFARLYGMGFGLGSSPSKAWQERIKKGLFSGALAPGSSPVRLPGQRKFWLAADCELIVYGATQADAKVTVAGKKIKLRPDGTFTLRFSLPDSKQVIPIKAESSDKIEQRMITPIVSRETK